jgi:uncharacterized membrane protein
MSTNPYAAPRAQVADETVVPRGDFLPAGRSVPTGNGWTWITQALALFRAAPGVWIGMALVWFIIFAAGGMIPVVGALATGVLWPVFVAGFATASRNCEQQQTCSFTDLFAGFRERFGPLVVVGVITLVISMVVFFAVFAMMGVGMSSMYGGRASLAMGLSVLLAILIATALLLPLAMATWFAAPLVLFHQVAPVEAMKMSFTGCLKNVLPFTIYGLLLLVAAFVATIPLGLGWLVLGPVMAASVYTAYRDIYFSAA